MILVARSLGFACTYLPPAHLLALSCSLTYTMHLETSSCLLSRQQHLTRAWPWCDSGTQWNLEVAQIEQTKQEDNRDRSQTNHVLCNYKALDRGTVGNRDDQDNESSFAHRFLCLALSQSFFSRCKNTKVSQDVEGPIFAEDQGAHCQL